MTRSLHKHKNSNKKPHALEQFTRTEPKKIVNSSELNNHNEGLGSTLFEIELSPRLVRVIIVIICNCLFSAKRFVRHARALRTSSLIIITLNIKNMPTKRPISNKERTKSVLESRARSTVSTFPHMHSKIRSDIANRSSLSSDLRT